MVASMEEGLPHLYFLVIAEIVIKYVDDFTSSSTTMVPLQILGIRL